MTVSAEREIKFFYPHVEVTDRRGRVYRTRAAVGYTVRKSSVVAAVSFVSIRDSFKRSVSRHITTSRLKDRKHRLTFRIPRDVPFNGSDFTSRLQKLTSDNCLAFPDSWVSLRVIDPRDDE